MAALTQRRINIFSAAFPFFAMYTLARQLANVTNSRILEIWRLCLFTLRDGSVLFFRVFPLRELTSLCYALDLARDVSRDESEQVQMFAWKSKNFACLVVESDWKFTKISSDSFLACVFKYFSRISIVEMSILPFSPKYKSAIRLFSPTSLRRDSFTNIYPADVDKAPRHFIESNKLAELLWKPALILYLKHSPFNTKFHSTARWISQAGKVHRCFFANTRQ